MTQDPANIDPGAEQEPPLEPLDEQLSAYLDGELAPDESRQVDLMLAGDAAVRKRLREIQRTWDALDELERTPVNERFTQSTLEIVTSAAVGESEATAATLPRLRRRRWLARTALLAAAVVLGFLAVLLLRRDPDRQLLADLPVVERLDQFRYVDNLKFLKQLAVEKLFDEDRTSPDDVSEPPQQVVGRGDESVKDRRQRIEQLAAPRKEELRRRWETYQSLDKAEQQRLHKLQEQLDADPDAAHLRASLDQYHKWLVTLPTFRRAELAELPADERVSRIQSMLDEQANQESRRLPPQDLAVVRRWLEQYSARNDEEPLLRILPESFRHRLGQMNPSERKRVLVSTMILAGRVPALSEQDLADLRGKLTPETRQKLESKTPADQWQIIAGAMRQAIQQQIASGGGKSPWSMVDDSELAKFFESGMTAEQRERLFNLSADQWAQELRRMYLIETKSGEWTERWPERPGHSKRGSLFPPDGTYPGRKKNSPPPGSRPPTPNNP